MTTLHSVLAPASEKAFIGNEPTWFDKVVDETTYTSQLLRGLNWHSYVAGEKNYRKYLEEWIKANRQNSKVDLANWKNVSDNDMDLSICKLARISMQGFPLSDEHKSLIVDYLDTIGKKEKKNVEQPVEKTTGPTIQDRMRQQVSSVLGDLDHEIDNAFEGNVIDIDKLNGDIFSKGFKGPQLKIVADYLQKQINEWKDAYNKVDEQLVEGYSYVGRRNMKHIIDTFESVIAKISQQVTHFNSQRIVKKKPLDKRKVASKLKFMKEFAEFNIKSVDAIDIIGANVVWVYDTKKRKLGYYEGEAKNSLFIRGTMIDGYKTSCEKILRKPEEQIPEILKLRKNQTLNWFEGVRAKCKEMNGRTNPNLILLRVD